MSRPWENIGVIPPRAGAADFASAAGQLGCSAAEIRAVWQVEAAGRPFRADNSVERRFEPHHFPKALWPDIGFSVRAGEAPWRASLRQSNEAMLRRAYDVDADRAMVASSWGGPQIMGFNAADAGFPTARAMVRAMARSEQEHLAAFTNLIIQWGLAPAIRAHDWETFARRYNGPGQVAHYANLLERAFGVTSSQKHAAALERASREQTGAPSRVVLRRGSEGRDVAELQRLLRVKDDGVFGIVTERAVRSVQATRGLTVDGVVGARTWAALGGSAMTNAATQPTTARPAGILETMGVAATAGAVSVAMTGTTVGWIMAGGLVAVAAGIVVWRAQR